MKTIIFIILCSVYFSACAQKDPGIPESAKNKLAELYPSVENIEWKMEGENEYEAVFSIDGVETSVAVDGEGNLLEIEEKISVDQLPEYITSSAAEKFPDQKISKVELITKNGEKMYEIEFDDGESKTEAIYSSDGKLIKYSVQGEKDEDNKDVDDDEEGEDEEDEEN